MEFNSGFKGLIVTWYGSIDNVNWMQVVQERDQWQALLNMVKKLRTPQKVG
jgi:hypothetical protein